MACDVLIQQMSDARDNLFVSPQCGRPIVILYGVFWHIEQFIGLTETVPCPVVLWINVCEEGLSITVDTRRELDC